MICPHCKANVKVQGKFCPKCGEQIFGVPVQSPTETGPIPSQPAASAPAGRSGRPPDASQCDARAQWEWETDAIAYVARQAQLSPEHARAALVAHGWDINATLRHCHSQGNQGAIFGWACLLILCIVAGIIIAVVLISLF